MTKSLAHKVVALLFALWLAVLGGLSAAVAAEYALDDRLTADVPVFVFASQDFCGDGPLAAEHHCPLCLPLVVFDLPAAAEGQRRDAQVRAARFPSFVSLISARMVRLAPVARGPPVTAA